MCSEWLTTKGGVKQMGQCDESAGLKTEMTMWEPNFSYNLIHFNSIHFYTARDLKISPQSHK